MNERLPHISELLKQKKKKRNKYNARKTWVDGFCFDSAKEAKYYQSLQLRGRAGLIDRFHRQVMFDLPGGIVYKCDFQVFNRDGSVEYIDVKGKRTKEYIMKSKQVKALYGIDIKEV